MALREYIVTLFNETPFLLRRQKADVSTGEWEVEVPTQIEPGGMAQWKTVSPGWFRGTSGAARFFIDDTKALVGPDEHPGHGGCLSIDWTNPYIGAPSINAALGACPDSLKGGDPTADYRLQASASTNSDPMYGWKEALVGNPFGALGGVQKMFVWYRLRPSSGVVVDASIKSGLVAEGLSDPVELAARPLASQPPHAWAGVWKEIGIGEPTLQVTISGPDVGGLFSTIIENRGNGTSERYEMVAEVRDISTPFSKPVWIEDAAETDVHVKVKPNFGGVDLRTVRDHRVGVSPVEKAAGMLKPVAAKLKFDMVDTLVLNPNARLELFGDFAPDKSMRRYRVRYVKTADDGEVHIDLLLYPHEIIR